MKPLITTLTVLAMLAACKHEARLAGLSGVKADNSQKPVLFQDTKGGKWKLFEEKVTWEDAQDQCKEHAERTQKRWRLPSPQELKLAKTDGISGPGNKAFGWIKLGKVWTASWENSVSLEEKLGVLGPKSSAHYVDMSEERHGLAVIDEQEMTVMCVDTGAFGNQWNDGKGQSWWYLTEKMNWPSAEVSCGELARRKRQAWRLPTSVELQSAMKAGIQSEKNKAFGREFLTYTWSAEIAPRIESEEAYGVDLRDGKRHLTDVDETLATVCVMDVPGQRALSTQPPPATRSPSTSGLTILTPPWSP